MRTHLMTLAAALFVVGCTCDSGTPMGTVCQFDGDCPGTDLCGPQRVCVAKPRCPDSACSDGQACVSGTCYSRACSNRTCGSGQVCAGGVCTDEACVGKSCAGGGTCVRGGCYVRSCELESCSQNEVCVAQECVSKNCLGVVCPADKRCAADGQCYDRGGSGGGPGTGPGPDRVPQATGGGSAGTGGAGAGMGGSGAGTGGSGAGAGGSGGSGGPGTAACGGRCTPVQVCIANQCVEARCVGVTCPMGQACAQGACVSNGCGSNGGACPSGQACGPLGTCVSTACATVQCPTGYGCAAGLCVVAPSLPDGGFALLPDGGPTVVIGPDGGVIGVPGPGPGGIATLPDGGAIGGPCLPGLCTEIACDNGADDNLNGLVDCADPSCNAQRCADADPCTLGETCQAGACVPVQRLTCNTPPPGPCWAAQGTCLANATCSYQPNFQGTCPNANEVCRGDGMCGPRPGMAFGFTPANVNPSMLPQPAMMPISISGQASFNSTTNSFSGGWSAQPLVQTVTTPTGPASVLLFDQFSMNAGSTLRLTGDKPVILVAFTGMVLNNAVIDASGRGQVPGPGGNVGCGASAGGAGGAMMTASGGGGGGSFHSAGARGGGGSTFQTGGVAGAARTRTRFDLLGGCPGGRGGGMQGGEGGAGGGAVQLVARFGILMDATRVLVNGAGGEGAGNAAGATSGGGGGGGSGGVLLIQAPYVVITRSTLVSNGGGGGEGAGIVDLGFLFGGGRPGADGNVVPGSLGAPGGAGGSFNGGNGGVGGARFASPGVGQPGTTYTDNQNNSLYQAGGGGGGGAAGAVTVDLITGSMFGFSACELDRDETVFSPTRDVPLACGG